MHRRQPPQHSLMEHLELTQNLDQLIEERDDSLLAALRVLGAQDERLPR